MFQVPPIPSFDGLHPLIIHFPISLLFIAPVFIGVGALLTPRRGRPLLYSALLLMIIGTASIFFSVETGEAAGKLADRTPEITAMLEHHEELAESTRSVFTVLTLIFAVIVTVPLFRRREPGRLLSTALPLVFLVAYGAGMVLLANTADHGGRLVHQLGVHAVLAPTGQAPSSDQQARQENAEEREDGHRHGR